MLFLFGESVRSTGSPLGYKECPVCLRQHPFTEQIESLWFNLFRIPLLKIEEKARYWRCEHCLNPFVTNNIDIPSQVAVTQQIVVYIMLGYGQSQQKQTAQEICLKLTGFDLTDQEYSGLANRLGSGLENMVEVVRRSAPSMNAVGKQAVVEAAFLATHVCCDLQYEDKLRVNLIGNALGVGLEFIDYAIAQSRKRGCYGIRRLNYVESALR